MEEKKAVVNLDPLPVVKGIDIQLRQLFYNLINNALKFNSAQPAANISSRIISAQSGTDFNPAAQSDNFHVISIEDNGIGMDSGYSGRIFDRFQRLHQRTRTSETALCKRIAENHIGVINLTSILS